MTTFRQIERNWSDRTFSRIAQTLFADRTDVDPVLVPNLCKSTAAAAAISLIRLDELGQSHRPLCSQLVRTILSMQTEDGGWGDVATSVLAIRALRCGGGRGVSIARGLDFLASLQKDNGAWPAEPIRRLSPDAAVTTFVLLHLSTDATFAALARPELAADWLEQHRDEMNATTRSQADRAITKCRRFAAANADAVYATPRKSPKPKSINGPAESLELFGTLSWS